MTTQRIQNLTRPTLRIKQAAIHHCLFLLPLLGVVVAVKIFENSMDGSLYAYFKSFRHSVPLLTLFVQVISKYTSFILLFIYLAVTVTRYRRGQLPQVRFLLGSMAVYYTLLSITLFVVKIGAGVPRPYTEIVNHNPLSLNSDYHSFPSGHTAECAAITSTLAHFAPSYCKTFLLGCILASVGFSRIYVGMHHPTDLLPGALLGSLAPLMASFLVHKRFWHRLPFARFFTDTASMQ